jgi:hypothetical protein
VARVDPLSRFKLAWLRRLGLRATPSFRAGACVPLLAIAFRMEAMGVRVLRRHIAVLRARPGEAAESPPASRSPALETRDAEPPPTLALLEEILVDEQAHVAACGGALERLIDASERPILDVLVARIDNVDRAFGVTGALALLGLSFGPRLGSIRRRGAGHARSIGAPGQVGP